jgi:uncharacterized protein (TIGR00661 family)
MKFLFIVQGEGRGHMTQAIVLSNMLQKNGHEVAEVMIGTSPHRQIPFYFKEKVNAPVSTFDSPNFTPSVNERKLSILKTVIYNFRNSPSFLTSLNKIDEKIEEHQPDTVINFYDLIAGLLFEIKRPKARLICIAHQYFFLHPHFRFPKPKNADIAAFIYYSKLTCSKADKVLALSLNTQPRYDSGKIRIVPPLIRPEILNIESTEGDYILGYMLNDSYEREIRTWHQGNPDVKLKFFSDRKQEKEIDEIDSALSFHKLNDKNFIEMLAGSKAYATTGGFESVCEAFYLGKPVMMVPAHVEQACNVVDAVRAGAGIGTKQFDFSQLENFIPDYKPNPKFKEWVQQAEMKFLQELC